jgi:hypothetical protein
MSGTLLYVAAAAAADLASFLMSSAAAAAGVLILLILLAYPWAVVGLSRQLGRARKVRRPRGSGS